ncbi:hypothetical protein ISS86_02480 [Candidatus Microgenomates bacterium]|nr:hypothetical protein [Candidatus Microgenomates bacterium]
MRKIFLISFLISLFFLLPSNVRAAKSRPPRGGNPQVKTTTRTYSRSRGIKASIRFRPDRHGLLINFSGFDNITSVTYALTYTADGIPQGARGTITAETAGEQRELLFGTCSGGVCRYHANITNARLVIDSELSSGIIIRKPYRVKV